MTSDWILRNLWHWSLIAAAIVGAAALCLLLVRIRAPRTRLGVLEKVFAIVLLVVPLVSVLAPRFAGDRAFTIERADRERFDFGHLRSHAADRVPVRLSYERRDGAPAARWAVDAPSPPAR